MARSFSIQFENAYYHVICWGKARQEIYAQDLDHSVFLKLLARSAETTGPPAICWNQKGESP